MWSLGLLGEMPCAPPGMQAVSSTKCFPAWHWWQEHQDFPQNNLFQPCPPGKTILNVCNLLNQLKIKIHFLQSSCRVYLSLVENKLIHLWQYSERTLGVLALKWRAIFVMNLTKRFSITNMLGHPVCKLRRFLYKSSKSISFNTQPSTKPNFKIILYFSMFELNPTWSQWGQW